VGGVDRLARNKGHQVQPEFFAPEQVSCAAIADADGLNLETAFTLTPTT